MKPKNHEDLVHSLANFKHFTCPYCCEYECSSKTELTRHMNNCNMYEECLGENIDVDKIIAFDKCLKSFREHFTKNKLYEIFVSSENKEHDIESIYTKMHDAFSSFCKVNGYKSDVYDVNKFHAYAYIHLNWFFDLDEHESEILEKIQAPFLRQTGEMWLLRL